MTTSNQITAANAGIALSFYAGHDWPGVAEFHRSVSLTRAADFQSSAAENRSRRSESDRLWMPTFGVTEGSARSASKVAGNGIRTGRSGASGGRISSPLRIIRDLISERTR